MRVAFATRSMNEQLSEASAQLLGLEGANAGWGRFRLTGTDNFGYFRELLRLDADWIVNIDEDAFLLDPGRLHGLIRTMEEGGYAACGMPDGGVVPIRRHNPAACNAFFNVFDMRRVRPAWSAWDRVVAARHEKEYESRIVPFAGRSTFAFDHFERYYGAFFSLLGSGERVLYLDAEEWTDGVSTLLKDATGAPLLLHCWYTRHYPTSYHTRQRYGAALDHARAAQGLNGWERTPPPNPLPEAERGSNDLWLPSPLRGGAGGGVDSQPLGPASAAPTLSERVAGANVATSPARVLEIDATTQLPGEQITGAEPELPYVRILCRHELAHQSNPDTWLRQARAALAADGCLIADLPNARHHAVVGALLQGRWILDGLQSTARPIVRYFTRREIEKLFHRAGFRIRKLDAVPGPGHAEWQQQGRRPEVRVGDLFMGVQTPGDAEEFYTARYHVEAVPAELPDHGLTSIVIVTYNQLTYTRLCISSIHDLTDEPYELILVDNGSTDSTPEYLASLAGDRLIRNTHNRGFPAGANQGMQAATGRQVLLLNNDTIVTTGWLGRMLNALHRDPIIGLVGPCSNRVSGEQQVQVRYDDLAQLDGFAWDWGKSCDRVIENTDRLVGFCLLVRRELIDAIGVLDERFGIGCYEDDDYCRRALRAGYRAVIARDAFVHHFGGRTFAGSGVDFAANMRHKEQLYREKWAGEPTDATPPRSGEGSQNPLLPLPEAERGPGGGVSSALLPLSASATGPGGGVLASPLSLDVRPAPGGGLLLGCKGIELSACIIARDNAATIGPCLMSIRKHIADIVVVDTGSKDNTPDIARQLGARVFHFPWCDSFSAARNESLRHARGKWIFWLDTDDTMDESNCLEMCALIDRGLAPEIMGCIVSVRCPGPVTDDDVDLTVVQHVKLFRNYPQLRFSGRIHEQIAPAIRALGGEIGWTNLFVVHSGYDHSPEGQTRKLERDFHLLNLELDERPDHPFTLFNLAMTYTDIKQYADGLRFAQRSIAASKGEGTHLRKAYAYLVICNEHLGQINEAWKACEDGLKLFPLDDELRFRKAGLLQRIGKLKEAELVYLDLLENHEAVHFGSVVDGMSGHLARHNLAMVYRATGDLALEAEQWCRTVEENPHFLRGWRGLGETLLRAGKYEEALALANRLEGDNQLRAEGQMLRNALEHHRRGQ